MLAPFTVCLCQKICANPLIQKKYDKRTILPPVMGGCLTWCTMSLQKRQGAREGFIFHLDEELISLLYVILLWSLQKILTKLIIQRLLH